MPEAPAHRGRQATRAAPAANCLKKVRRLSIGRQIRFTVKVVQVPTNKRRSLDTLVSGRETVETTVTSRRVPGQLWNRVFEGVLCGGGVGAGTAFTSWETSYVQ